MGLDEAGAGHTGLRSGDESREQGAWATEAKAGFGGLGRVHFRGRGLGAGRGSGCAGWGRGLEDQTGVNNSAPRTWTPAAEISEGVRGYGDKAGFMEMVLG